MGQALGGMDALTIYVVVGLLVVGESSGVVALVMPGELALLAGGAAAATGRVSLPLVIAVAVTGAVAGHAVGYELGRRYGLRMLRWPLLRGHADRIQGATRLVARYGAAALVLGRWMNVGRIVIPMLSGAARMRYSAFTLYNVLGGVIWVVTVVMLGSAAGASIGGLHAVAGQLSAWLAGTLVFAAVAVLTWRRVRRRRTHVHAKGVGEGGERQCPARLVSSSTTAAGV